ncbi:MAG TPA: hypothetical protein VJ983_10185 [candidate division Zixibacteria bacterium]|nr:hypothetical protein [candidate division Zixibacteria bacterium]
MEAMNQNAITQLERELVTILKEEYTFYQSLYVLLDKQKDLIRFNKDEKLLDLFAEIERCHMRIKKSEEKITSLRERNPKLFKLAAISPDIRKVLNGIITLVKKSISVVSDNEEYLTTRYERLKEELGELKNSEKILQYVQSEKPSPQFVDGNS